LHDIGFAVLPQARGIECLIVSIKLLHILEIGVTDSNNNNSHGEAGSSHHLVNGFLHVVNDAIGDDQLNEELLIHLVNLLFLRFVHDFLKDVCEVGRAIEVDVL